ncbi:extracellular solute-binding protein [Paenibacillus sp. KQZ6P-2]|uniref:Extracellular solute-binding protein n=1 Tax=Paenibacillus mangrovi TaxID=2931978 RepID=A0A9X1WSD3_9BACL|nr:extracellular solute-binding protein [Paenibacillus mangrovi]MCJ8010849.1 extracellular solute-binding protein [Paenibacillus mangrovi]
MNKKTALFIVALLCILTACKGSGTLDTDSAKAYQELLPFERYEHPVMLSVGAGVDPNYKTYTGETPANNPWIKAIQETLNVHVNIAWIVTNQNMEQKVDLTIASNTLPDAMVVTPSQLSQMVKADELADLTTAYNDYASPVMKSIMDSTNGAAMSQVTFNGQILALPSVAPEDISMLWIRKDWLDQLGLQPPATLDELEATARAFVERDPDGNGKADTIGIAAGVPLYDDYHAGPGSFNLNPIFSAYNAYPGFWLKDAQEKPVYGSIQSETKAALEKLRDMYANGLIDREMGIRDSAAEVVINGKAGMFFAPFSGGYWPVPEALKNNPRANWQAYALPLDADGKFNAKVFQPTKSFIVVRKGYKHPEAVVKVTNLILRDEYLYGIDFQPLRNTLAPHDEIPATVRALQAVLSGERNPEDFDDKVEYTLLNNDVYTIKNTKLAPYSSTDIQYWDARDPNFKRAYSLLVGGRNLLDPNLNKVHSIYESQTGTIENQWRHLINTEMELFTQIIMGAAPLEAFDEWVEDWKRQGGDLMTTKVELELNRQK